MAETTEGGCYLTAEGRWVTAEGKPATKAQIAEHQLIQEQRAEQLAQIEQDNIVRAARNDPAARAFAALTDRLSPASPPAAPSKPAKPASKPAAGQPDPGDTGGSGDIA